VLRGAAAAMAATLVVAGALMAARGLPGRFTPAEQRLAAWKDGDYEASFRRGTCFLTTPGATLDPACLTPARDTRPKVLLIGDSMAAHLWPGLSGYRDRFDILQATIAGCTPGIYPDADKPCERLFRDVLTRWVPAHPGVTVVLAGRWQDFDLPSLAETTAFLQRRGVATVVVGAPPIYQQDLPRLLTLASRRGDPSIVDRGRDPASPVVNARVRAVAATQGANFVSLLHAWCAHGRCRTLITGNVPMQFDYGHLTPQGSALAAREIVPVIGEAEGRR
jgi:hypothetical protein